MKTKISNIASIVTWSNSANKIIYQNNLEILIVDDSIVEISDRILYLIDGRIKKDINK